MKSLLKSREIFPRCGQRCCQTDRCACAVRKMATSRRLVVVTYQVETSGHECSETVKYPAWPQHDVYRITCAASGQLDVDSWNGFLDTGRWGTGLHAAVSSEY